MGAVITDTSNHILTLFVLTNLEQDAISNVLMMKDLATELINKSIKKGNKMLMSQASFKSNSRNNTITHYILCEVLAYSGDLCAPWKDKIMYRALCNCARHTDKNDKYKQQLD